MPPASLSTLAVMKPGPTTARRRARRVRQTLNHVMGGSVPVLTCVDASSHVEHSKHMGALYVSPSASKGGPGSVVVAQHRDHVVGRDDAGDAAVLVDDR